MSIFVSTRLSKSTSFFYFNEEVNIEYQETIYHNAIFEELDSFVSDFYRFFLYREAKYDCQYDTKEIRYLSTNILYPISQDTLNLITALNKSIYQQHVQKPNFNDDIEMKEEEEESNEAQLTEEQFQKFTQMIVEFFDLIITDVNKVRI